MFRIIKVRKTNPVTYLLKNFCGKPVAGGFYEYELLIPICISLKKCCKGEMKLM